MRTGADRGAITVEAALALCSLALVTALAIGSVAAVVTVAARLAPTGARVELVIRGDEAVVEVTAAPLQLPGLHVVGRAVAVLEPEVTLTQGDPDTAGPAP
jgi:hypothetical protein